LEHFQRQHALQREYGRLVLIVDTDSTRPGIEENKATFSRGFRRTLSALRDANKSVVVVGPIPAVFL
jgi:hypothetical protein